MEQPPSRGREGGRESDSERQRTRDRKRGRAKETRTQKERERARERKGGNLIGAGRRGAMFWQ
eukprot:COSAG03_NODE_7658_length_887_cov_12.984787_2_plen_62_part_01